MRLPSVHWKPHTPPRPSIPTHTHTHNASQHQERGASPEINGMEMCPATGTSSEKKLWRRGPISTSHDTVEPLCIVTLQASAR